jgi:hypothetical protein
MICQLFDLKTIGMGFSGLTSKPVATVSLNLASKLLVDFLIEHKNQGGGGFSSLELKTGSCILVIWD